MADTRVLRTIGALILVLLVLSFLVPPRPVLASRPAAPPMQTPTPEPNPITQIINQIIQFPFENLTQALQNAMQSMLTNSVAPLESIFSASIGRWLTSSPGIITPGGGIANGGDVMGPAWRLMIKVAVLLWPLTLAVIAAIAAKDAVAAASWGIGDLKEALGGWLIAVVASGTSLYWMDLSNRFANATTSAILNMSFTGEAGFQPNALTGLVFGTAGILLNFLAPPASLFIVIFVILLGLAVLTALIFQFMARFVVLYVLVALAPVVIILSILPPMRWFGYTWLRGFVLVEAIGPINALLLKLVMILAVRGSSNDPITAFVNFIGALGALSILLTIDGVIIKGVFGAVQEVAQKAMSTVTGLVTLAVAGATALAGGSIAAAGGIAAAGTSAAGGGTGGLSGPGGSGGAIAASATNSTGPAQTARKAFNPGTALRGAGDVLFRQPGVLGSVGAAMRSLGGTMEQRDKENQAAALRQQNQAARSNALQTGRRNGSGGGNPTGIAPSGPSNPSASPTSPLAPTPGGNGGSNRPASPAPTQNPGSASLGSNAAPSASRASGAANPGPAIAPSAAALPPAQTPSVNPMGKPMPPSPTVPTQQRSVAPSSSLTAEAAGTLSLLPAPMRERGTALALQSAPQDQPMVARAAVEASSALEFSGRFATPGAMAAAWDRGMAPVLASAREGLPLSTMAQDAGFGSNVAGFISHRMTQGEAPRLETPSQAVAWHPQLAPHDWEMGSAISRSLSSPEIKPGTAARLYHEIRSPEAGGWSAGAQFIETVREVLNGKPSDPVAALHARLTEIEARNGLSSSAMALWRASVRSVK